MQTWTVVRYLHIVGITFFVGGQLMLVAAVAPAIRRRGDDQTMRLIARRFGLGSTVALALAVATGIAMASHCSLLGLEHPPSEADGARPRRSLDGLHIMTPKSRAVSYGVVASSLLVLWFGVKLTYG
jgi:hypothetical protein